MTNNPYLHLSHKIKHLIIYILALMPVCLFAQPVNDDCANATLIPETVDWCSAVGAYTLTGATPSSIKRPTCWVDFDTVDVWFVFVATHTDVAIRVVGAPAGGTLTSTKVALYKGSCGNLTEIGCNNPVTVEVAEAIVNNLPLGEMIYVRVAGIPTSNATFQLCINTFNQIPNPSSDCPTAVLLCDKSPFSVKALTSNGNLTNEIPAGTCFEKTSDCNGFESSAIEFQSAWYKWECDQPGSLTFVLTPSNPDDDLDWILFELPDGIDDCNNKQVLRCNCAGEDQGEPDWRQRCYGSTGLRDGDSDDEECRGCFRSNNNYVAPIQMQPGKVYMLMVNNYSQSGNGFSIKFGGTGTFKGPNANFAIDSTRFKAEQRFCWGDTIKISDLSYSTFGNITDWVWTFGPDSNPGSATTKGDKTVVYGKSGEKTILLSIKNEAGCIVSRTIKINLECCNVDIAADAGPDQTIELGDSTVISALIKLIGNDVTFKWTPPDYLAEPDNTTTGAKPVNTTLYTISAMDEFNCKVTDSVLIRIVKNLKTFAPNAFSPNDDGSNDGFTIFSNKTGKKINFLRVYSRWGALVFDGRDLPLNDPKYGWDGTFKGELMNAGVFAYVAEVEFLDNTVILLKGDLTLVR